MFQQQGQGSDFKDQILKSYIDQVFDKYDTDKSNSLDQKQMTKFFNDLFKSLNINVIVTQQQAVQAIKSIDINYDGSVNKAQLFSAFKLMINTPPPPPQPISVQMPSMYYNPYVNYPGYPHQPNQPTTYPYGGQSLMPQYTNPQIPTSYNYIGTQPSYMNNSYGTNMISGQQLQGTGIYSTTGYNYMGTNPTQPNYMTQSNTAYMNMSQNQYLNSSINGNQINPYNNLYKK